MPSKGKTIPSHVNALERRKFATELRASGVLYADIALAVKQKFGDKAPASYDERMAWRDVMIVLDKYKKDLAETAEDVRTMMLTQIDGVMLTVYQKALAGDPKAVASFIRLQDQKARLVGAYAPAQVKITDWRSEILQLMQSRQLTDADIRGYLGEQLYREFVEQRSPALLEAGEAEEGNFIEVEEPVAE